jgi:hypothetical protein
MITISSSSPFLSYPRHVTCRMFPVLKLIDLILHPITRLQSHLTSPDVDVRYNPDRPLRSRPLRLDPSQHDPHPHTRAERIHRGPFFLFWYLFFRVTRFHGTRGIERREAGEERDREHALYRTIHYKDGRQSAGWEGDRGCGGDVGGCAC